MFPMTQTPTSSNPPSEREILGRLSRKFVWLSLQASGWIHHSMLRAFASLPYVKKLNTQQEWEKTIRRILELTTYYGQLREVLRALPFRPKISILVPVYKCPKAYLEECLGSVAQQIYDNWELCIVDDCSNDPTMTKVIEDFRLKYPDRVKFAVNERNSHISVTSNHCLKLATGDYVALLDHDDRLFPNALAEVVRYLNFSNRPEILYSDERNIDEYGERLYDVYHKPGWSPFMHLCMNYTTHLSVYRTELIRRIGGFRKGFEGSQDHDLMLRAVEQATTPVVHIPMCLYQWRAHPESTAASVESKPYAALAGEKAVSEALVRRKRPGRVTYEPKTQHFRLEFELPSPRPPISLILNGSTVGSESGELGRQLARICQLTTYEPVEILICGGPPDLANVPEAKRFRVRHVPLEATATAGQAFNQAARAASGEYLVFVGSHLEPVDATWLHELLGLAQFPEVGAVGTKVLLPDGTHASAGKILTSRRGAEPIGTALPKDHGLYCQILHTIHECGAVSHEGFLIKASKFWEVEGFEETYLPLDFIDADLCLRLVERGYSHLYTPYARLRYLREPRPAAELHYFARFYLRQRYPRQVHNDSNLNPNLNPNALFNIDGDFEKLDLSRSEFDYFLQTPSAAWGEPSTLMNFAKHWLPASAQPPARRARKAAT